MEITTTSGIPEGFELHHEEPLNLLNLQVGMIIQSPHAPNKQFRKSLYVYKVTKETYTLCEINLDTLEIYKPIAGFYRYKKFNLIKSLSYCQYNITYLCKCSNKICQVKYYYKAEAHKGIIQIYQEPEPEPDNASIQTDMWELD